MEYSRKITFSFPFLPRKAKKEEEENSRIKNLNFPLGRVLAIFQFMLSLHPFQDEEEEKKLRLTAAAKKSTAKSKKVLCVFWRQSVRGKMFLSSK